jgi:hypothetical protein
MEARLSDKIDGQCSSVEHRVTEVEQQTKERLIALEMFCTEAETGHANIEKWVDDLCLEVSHLNHFHKREHVQTPQRSSASSSPRNRPPCLRVRAPTALKGTTSKNTTGIMNLVRCSPTLISRSMVRLIPNHFPVLSSVSQISLVHVNPFSHLILHVQGRVDCLRSSFQSSVGEDP